METISNFAVVINAGLVAFTGTYAIEETWTARVWIFICMAGGVFTATTILGSIVPDVPEEVEIQVWYNMVYFIIV
jgi:hypothetical protein